MLRGTSEAGIKIGASGLGWKVKGQVLRTPISGTHCSPRFGVWGVANVGHRKDRGVVLSLTSSWEEWGEGKREEGRREEGEEGGGRGRRGGRRSEGCARKCLNVTKGAESERVNGRVLWKYGKG